MARSIRGHKVLHLQYTRDFEVQLRDSGPDLIRKLFPVDSLRNKPLCVEAGVLLLGPSIYSQILALVKQAGNAPCV